MRSGTSKCVVLKSITTSRRLKKKSQNNKLLMKQQLAHNHFPNNSIAFHLTDINSV